MRMQTTSYIFSGIDAAPLAYLFGKSDGELHALGARRMVADAETGFPCRVSLCEAAPGQSVILTAYEHQRAPSPYRASGPIFVVEGSTTAARFENEVPPVVRTRLMSVRAYDADDLIVDAEVIEGAAIEQAITRMFAYERVRYLHLHNARRGCYSCRVDRA
jgi:Protein of unknown function (DUF1203)